FLIVKGKADPDNLNAVDGMSGATITGNGIQKFLQEEYAKYHKFYVNQSAN
ncbi:MAG: Na+-transporting NADH:ubiquinone oxidoreductase subunit NqrC, partial [Kiritimatiellia bacterium]